VAQRFVTPPNWPRPPEGWLPPSGWQPDPTWGPAPTNWQFWVDDLPAPPPRPVTVLPPTPLLSAHVPEVIGEDGQVALVNDHVVLAFTDRRSTSAVKRAIGLRAYPLAVIADIRVLPDAHRGHPTLQVVVRPDADLLRPLLKNTHPGPGDDPDTLILRKGGTVAEAEAFAAGVRARLAGAAVGPPTAALVDTGRLPITVSGSNTRATFDGVTVMLEVSSWTASPAKKNAYPRQIPASAVTDVLITHPRLTGQLSFLLAGGPDREAAIDPKADLNTVELNADDSQSYAVLGAAVLTAARRSGVTVQSHLLPPEAPAAPAPPLLTPPPPPLRPAATPPPPRVPVQLSGEQALTTHVLDEPEKISRLGAHKRAQELATEVVGLRQRVAALDEQLSRLGALTVSDLERQAELLRAEQAGLRASMRAERDEHARGLAAEAEQARTRAEQQLSELNRRCAEAQERLTELAARVVVTDEEVLLQEAGIYRYRHPLSDAIAYQVELAKLQDQIKTMAKRDGGAVTGATSWSINGSASQGRAMVRDFSKLMLRAYNAEADTLVRSLKPFKVEAAIDRLSKVTETIARLGKTMDIRISAAYHRLRVKELELTADHLAMVAEEKEREREEKQRLREERKAQQEIEREKERLEKERQHYRNAYDALLAGGDLTGAEQLQAKLDDLQKAIEDADYRAANIRAGYVYVISNVGAFGEGVVKVGMTRRLDPMDRVRELGDASVPFRFDVHAIHFSDDAVGIEAAIHHQLADRRVNMVNPRREFFHTTPGEVKALLAKLAGNLLQFEDFPEALEYRQSLVQQRALSSS